MSHRKGSKFNAKTNPWRWSVSTWHAADQSAGLSGHVDVQRTGLDHVGWATKEYKPNNNINRGGVGSVIETGHRFSHFAVGGQSFYASLRLLASVLFVSPQRLIRAKDEQDRLCKYTRNIEACSRNHCCCGKAVSISYSECVFVDLGFRHSMRIRHIVICDLPWLTNFF